LVILGSLGILSAFAVFAIRHLRLRASSVKSEVNQSNDDGLSVAARTALRELRDIAGRNFPVEQLYPAVANGLRTYAQSQFRIPALDLTTVELLQGLPPHLPVSLQRELQRILEQADLVKFACYQPDAETARRYMDGVEKWVRVADQSIHESAGVVD
jgi:hypothetical protein